jgi:hypothetical protein
MKFTGNFIEILRQLGCGSTGLYILAPKIGAILSSPVAPLFYTIDNGHLHYRRNFDLDKNFITA